jgi:hypothetical protein
MLSNHDLKGISYDKKVKYSPEIKVDTLYRGGENSMPYVRWKGRVR